MRLHGPRPVHALARRVCLPRRLAMAVRIEPGRYVRVFESVSREGELLVQVTDSSGGDRSRRDVGRPRRVNPHGQVTLPAVLLDRVGVSVEDPWVYFAPDDRGVALRVIPASRVELVGAGGGFVAG